jgi:peptidoglycan hydrolase CwlO-like protein
MKTAMRCALCTCLLCVQDESKAEVARLTEALRAAKEEQDAAAAAAAESASAAEAHKARREQHTKKRIAPETKHTFCADALFCALPCVVCGAGAAG